jgi:serine/threonine-protein kinase
MAVWTEWNWEKGETEFKRCIELNPNNALYRIYYAHLLMTLRRSDEALYQANKALELDPLKPLVMALFGAIMINVGDYTSAIIQAEKALSIEPGHFFATTILEYASYFNGDYEKALKAAKQIIPFEDKTIAAVDKIYSEQGYFPALKVMINSLEEFAETGSFLPFDLAERYVRLKEYDKALNWLERGYEIHDPSMPYITFVFFDYDQLKNNPRFIELLKKLKLPLQ